MTETQERALLSSRDLLRFQMADDPQISPDGMSVAWVRTWIDGDGNRYCSQICVTTIDHGTTQALTDGKGQETHPRWSPDGRFLAFGAQAVGQPGRRDTLPIAPAVSVIGSQKQLFVIPATGGEARQLTQMLGGVQEPAWSPDGNHLAFVTYVDESVGLEHMDDDVVDDPYAHFNRDVLVTDRLDWKRDGVGYVGPYRQMIASIPFAVSDDAAHTSPVLLTRGAFDLAGPAWSPDGTKIAVVGTLQEEHPTRRRAVYLFDSFGVEQDASTPLLVLEDIRNPTVAWSPDGSRLVVCGHHDASVGHYGNQHLWIVEAATAEAYCVTEKLDNTWGNIVWTDVGRYGGMEGPRWTPDGRFLLALLSRDGDVRLCRVPLHPGPPVPLTPENMVVAAFSIDQRAERAVVLVWQPLAPSALYILDFHDETPRTIRSLLDPNAELIESFHLSEPERFTFSSGEVEIDGWVIPPVRPDPGASYPTILYHGGGPGGMRGPNFIFEFQLYAASGYAVVFFNTRGCQGYGQAFCTAILGNWGGADYEDNLRGLEVACDRYSFIDPARLLTAGGSYGGYQVNWILGRDHRFKAAVSDRSVFNRLSSYGTSDIGYLREFEFDGGPPWETAAAYIRQSPLTFIGAARTPTLVVHSARDYRCPIEQGEQLYLALKRLNVPTELVRFPNESHGLSRTGRPWHRIFRLDRYLDWFARWLD